MIRYQEIVKDAGGSLQFDPPEPARPSSATVSLYLPAASAAFVDGATATVDACTTTLAAAAAARTGTGDAPISITSAADVVNNRTYVITNAGGQYEFIRAAAASTAATPDTVTIYEALSYDYESGDAFVGNRLTYTVGAADAAALTTAARAVWSYVISGVTYTATQNFDVVRSSWPDVALRPDEFAAIVGDLANTTRQRSSHRGRDFSEEIATAYEQVRRHLFARGLRPSRFQSVDPFKDAIAQKVLLNRAADATPREWDPAAWHDLRQDAYNASFQGALNSALNYDADEGGTLSDTEKTRTFALRFTR